MLYRAQPVIVNANKILSVAEPDSGGTRILLVEPDKGREFDDGLRAATAPMLARYTPIPGDYWVEQGDGYVYLNPKAVFERKYEAKT